MVCQGDFQGGTSAHNLAGAYSFTLLTARFLFTGAGLEKGYP